MQRIRAVEIVLKEGAQATHLRFEEIWLNSLVKADIFLPQPIGAGILVVDIQAWKWEQPILVIADDEEYQTLFGASSVEKLKPDTKNENGV